MVWRREHDDSTNASVGSSAGLFVGLVGQIMANHNIAQRMTNEINFFDPVEILAMDEATFREDARTLVEAYPDRSILEGAVRHYLAPPRLFWRGVWWIDRRIEQRRTRRAYKYRSLEVLDEALRDRTLSEGRSSR